MRGPGGGSRTSSVVEAKGREAVLLPGGITNKAFCEAWVKKAAIDIGGRNILVNNVGK